MDNAKSYLYVGSNLAMTEEGGVRGGDGFLRRAVVAGAARALAEAVRGPVGSP